MSNDVNHSLSLTPPSEMPGLQRLGLTLTGLGLLALLIAFLGSGNINPLYPVGFGLAFLAASGILLTRDSKKDRSALIGVLVGVGAISLLLTQVKFNLSGTSATAYAVMLLGLILVGLVLYYYTKFGTGVAGVRNDGNYHSSAVKPGGTITWILTITFTGFYVILYWFPENLTGAVAAVDPIYYALTGNHSIPGMTNADGSESYLNQWFLYGLIYTVLVLVMGFRFILKYRHNRYQVLRTLSVSFFQLTLAFLLPAIFEAMQGKAGVFSHYFSYFWPLDYDALFPSSLEAVNSEHFFPKFVVYWGTFMSFLAVPVLTYFYGKRWYCSWVCGCGGLAETAGDHFRHNSDKSLKAWQFERISIYSVLVFITVTTVLLLINWKWHFIPDNFAYGLKSAYGFLIGSIFAGVVGTGFYPLLGSRVWCRFGCPQAAVLGILQKYFSRFRITTNGSQCISCGNCSTYCEMGIDVKWYAQRGQNIVRASCVGCGLCSAVCPRGVLNLENGPTEGRVNDLNPLSISADEVKVNA